MIRAALFLTLALFGPGPAHAKGKTDPALVGSWGTAGETLYTFKADGTGAAEADSFRWTADGKTLKLMGGEMDDEVRYAVKGDRLLLTMGGAQLAFERMGGKGKRPKAAPAKRGKARDEDDEDEDERPAARRAAPQGRRGGGGAEGDQLSRLLLSSPWCSFSYNKVSGSSSSKRVTFSPDGSWSLGGRSEGYSSGSAGTFSSQHDSGDGGQWKVQGGALYMSSSESPSLAPVDFTVSQNSNGYPIIKADGVEYSQCR